AVTEMYIYECINAGNAQRAVWRASLAAKDDGQPVCGASAAVAPSHFRRLEDPKKIAENCASRSRTLPCARMDIIHSRGVIMHERPLARVLRRCRKSSRRPDENHANSRNCSREHP